MKRFLSMLTSMLTSFRPLLASFRLLAAILGIISFFIAMLVQFFLPELPESVFGMLILCLVLFLVFIAGSLSEIKHFMIGKRGRYGLNTTIMIIVFIGVLLLANYLGAIKHFRIDVTASGKFTLAPQTINVIRNLKSTVEAIGFFPEDPQYRPIKREAQYLLEEYRFFNKDFRFKFIDPETKPAIARQYRIKYNGTIVFVSGKRQKLINAITEQDFTGAILEVMGVEAKRIYFLAGHGERDITDEDESGFSIVRKGLIRDLYKVGILNLARGSAVPEDCAALVIAGASKSIPPEETKAIRHYLKNHGKVLILTDPNPPIEIQQILSDWGARIPGGHVVDQWAFAAPDKSTPAIFRGNYLPMIITNGLDTTYFPEAASVDLTGEFSRVLDAERAARAALAKRAQGQGKQEPPAWPQAAAEYRNLVILPALLTTKASWLEKGKGTSKSIRGINKGDGPLVIGAMLIASAPLADEVSEEKSDDKLTRIVIIGDSDFASNLHIQNGGNGDLFLNSVNWLTEEEHLIDIRPKQYSFRRLLISDNASRFIRFFSIGLLPLLIIILGVVMWWRNR